MKLLNKNTENSYYITSIAFVSYFYKLMGETYRKKNTPFYLGKAEAYEEISDSLQTILEFSKGQIK